MTDTKIKNIAVINDKHESWLIGIYRYAQKKSWEIIDFQKRQGKNNLLLDPFISKDNFDGVIGFLGTEKLDKQDLDLNIPFVNIYGGKPSYPKLPQIGVSGTATEKMAADYFISQGYRNFAFQGFGGMSEGIGSTIGKAFEERLNESGFFCDTFLSDKKYPKAEYKRKLFRLSTADSICWISSLPLPVAILAIDDQRGTMVINACNILGLKIPQDVAVLGIGDNLIQCNIHRGQFFHLYRKR